jgi:hypothetical protein
MKKRKEKEGMRGERKEIEGEGERGEREGEGRRQSEWVRVRAWVWLWVREKAREKKRGEKIERATERKRNLASKQQTTARITRIWSLNKQSTTGDQSNFKE